MHLEQNFQIGLTHSTRLVETHKGQNSALESHVLLLLDTFQNISTHSFLFLFLRPAFSSVAYRYCMSFSGTRPTLAGMPLKAKDSALAVFFIFCTRSTLTEHHKGVFMHLILHLFHYKELIWIVWYSDLGSIWMEGATQKIVIMDGAGTGYHEGCPTLPIMRPCF